MTTATHPTRAIWPLGRATGDPLPFLEGLGAAGGDVVPFHLGRRPAFLLTHPACIEDVLVRQSPCS